MKYCPNCTRHFSDLINFCLADGARLQTTEEMQNADTVLISEDTLIMPMTQEDARLLFNESAVEQAAAKLNDTISYRHVRSQWRHGEGVKDATNELKILFNDLQNLAEKVSEKNPHVPIRFSIDNEKHCTVSSAHSDVYLSVNWGCMYHELDSYTLSIILYKGRYPHSPKELSASYYEGDIDEALELAGGKKNGEDSFLHLLASQIKLCIY